MPDLSECKVKSKEIISAMYITGLLQYLIWPLFIVVSWFIIKAALALYEKKFPVDKENS